MPALIDPRQAKPRYQSARSKELDTVPRASSVAAMVAAPAASEVAAVSGAVAAAAAASAASAARATLFTSLCTWLTVRFRPLTRNRIPPFADATPSGPPLPVTPERSEERRVGKECRAQ